MDGGDLPSVAGHRVLPHTADLIVEAWAPTLCGCLGEAVAGLVASFAETGEVPATRTVRVAFYSTAPDDLLVDILEEVIYGIDVFGAVPVTAVFEDAEAGGVAGSLELAPIQQVDIVGALPKAVSLSGLMVEHDGEWRARATIDV